MIGTFITGFMAGLLVAGAMFVYQSIRHGRKITALAEQVDSLKNKIEQSVGK